MSSESLQKRCFHLAMAYVFFWSLLMLSKWTTFTGTDNTKQINPALGLSLQIHISFRHTLTYVKRAEWEIKIIDLKESCFVNSYSEHNECKLHRNIKNSSREKQRQFHISLIIQPINIPIHLPCWKRTASLVTNKCCVLDAGVFTYVPCWKTKSHLHVNI